MDNSNRQKKTEWYLTTIRVLREILSLLIPIAELFTIVWPFFHPK
jgi:hypothetical protein